MSRNCISVLRPAAISSRILGSFKCDRFRSSLSHNGRRLKYFLRFGLFNTKPRAQISGVDLDAPRTISPLKVSTPLPLRILRAMKRDKLSREEVKARMEKQLDEAIKMRLCDFVVFNDEQELVIPQVIKIHETLLASKH